MLDRIAFDRAIRTSPCDYERFAIFGALLARDSGLGRNLVITGGAAISIRLSQEGVTQDVDIIGLRSKIHPVLERWEFEPVDDPDGRRYWVRSDLGLEVDIINRSMYSGRVAGVRTITTPFGPARVAAVEDLIVRRLVFWSRDGTPKLLDQAIALYVENRRSVDEVYLRGVANYERVDKAYLSMKELADRVSKRTSSPRRSTLKKNRARRNSPNYHGK